MRRCWPRRERQRSDGRKIRAAASRQRDRKLHQGRTACSRAYRGDEAVQRQSSAPARALGNRSRGHARTVTAAVMPAPRHAGAERYSHKYIIAATVTMAAMLELIDTSIVNVAIPHMMGNLGATLDEIAWVSTSYIIANVIIIPMSGWLSAYYGRN